MGSIRGNIKTNKLKAVCPKLEEGLLRVGSRVNLADLLAYDCLNPIILPNPNALTSLIVQHTHERVLKHVGRGERVFHELKTKFWIPKGRALCKKICTLLCVMSTSRRQAHDPANE